ncbi:zinc-ribbon domain-containing protein [Eubacteriales bacterium OttesenSCG-928-G02]|nr:zinc-ribbon domain-containing protein [Eubacteriales bacterium OttesenSCG-928-G02]
MAFCNKCGSEVSDESKFCPSCGSSLGEGKTSEVEVLPEVKPAENDLSTLPIVAIIKIVAAVFAFIFLFLPWYKVDLFYLENSYSVFDNVVPELANLFMIAKVFAWITIVVFIIHILLTIFNLEKLSQGLKKYHINILNTLAFYGLYLFTMFIGLLGILFTDGVDINFGWFVSLVAVLIFAALSFLAPKIRSIIIKSQKK